MLLVVAAIGLRSENTPRMVFFRRRFHYVFRLRRRIPQSLTCLYEMYTNATHMDEELGALLDAQRHFLPSLPLTHCLAFFEFLTCIARFA